MIQNLHQLLVDEGILSRRLERVGTAPAGQCERHCSPLVRRSERVRRRHDDPEESGGRDGAFTRLIRQRPAFDELRDDVGETFSLADCAASPALFYANQVMPFGDGHKNLTAYFERLTARPSFARVIKEAEPYFAMFPQET